MATVTGRAAPSAAEARSTPLVPIAWFSALLLVVYFPVLQHLVGIWASDEDMGHGFFVPLVAAYIVWQRRERLLAIHWEPAWWGIAVILLGILESYIGTIGAEQFMQASSILVTLVGVLLTCGGIPLVRELAFPLLLLPFMIPLPALIYNKITLPLQFFASAVAENVLNFIGIPVLRDGNVLELAHQKLDVAEACSGIRSLLSLTFLSLVYAYFFDRRVWMRGVLFLATIPIAILANAARVTITGVVSEEIDPSLAQGFSHTLQGWIIFLVALGLLIGFHSILSGMLKARKPAEAGHA